MTMDLNLSEDDSLYDLNFIAEKLARCSTYMERLSGIEMKLTKISIVVLTQYSVNKNEFKRREQEIRTSDEYREMDRGEKAAWLSNRLAEVGKLSNRWSLTQQVVSEIKGAVSGKVSMMKRLDSDLRLHSKIYEAKVAAGAAGPSFAAGTAAMDMDLG